jgi:hypothetical protein
MRPLRWKNRYLTGQAETDQHNKTFVECLNNLMNATRQREHCREIEDFLDQLAHNADALLERRENSEIAQAMRARLLGALPLPTRHTASCHDCGICELAEQKVAEHLEAPAQCLNLDKPKS